VLPAAPRAVLFDFADTLFHQGPGPQRVAEAAAEAGHAVEPAAAAAVWDEVVAARRPHDGTGSAHDLAADAHRRHWTAHYTVADRLGTGTADALYRRHVRPASWRAFDDTAPVLAALAAASIPVAVVTNNGWDVRPVLDATGTGHLVAEVVVSYEVGVVKPEPAIFHLACARLGVAPGGAVMVGDDPVADGGAVRAGVPALVLPSVDHALATRGLGAVLRLCGIVRR
jgi:FMN phosphatase YigB (HAD superfamily)